MPAANIKNVTFALPVTMMDEIRQLAKSRRQSSINSLVREALERYLAEKRNREIAAIRRRYSELADRTFPVAIEFLIPEGFKEGH